MTDTATHLTFDSVGQKLPNGTTILAISARNAHEWVILAQDDDGEYITWRCARPGDGADTYWGHYFDDLDQATADYKER